jgi:hypothetical protein
MQSTRGIDRGGKHPNEDKITTKALDAKNRIQKIIQYMDKMWRPRFLFSVISANDQISRVKPAGTSQT